MGERQSRTHREGAYGQCNKQGKTSKVGHRNYAGTVPISAFRAGDFSALLGSQIGTDALGRPILSGQLMTPTALAPSAVASFAILSLCARDEFAAAEPYLKKALILSRSLFLEYTRCSARCTRRRTGHSRRSQS